MPYVSQAQQRFFHANEGKGGITPAVVQEYDDATPDTADLPERASNGPGSSFHGQLATHHAIIANHYKGRAAKELGNRTAPLKAIEQAHRALAAAHAQAAKDSPQGPPDPKRQVIIRAQTAAAKRGLMPSAGAQGPPAGPPGD